VREFGTGETTAIEPMLFYQLHVLASITDNAAYKMIAAYRSPQRSFSCARHDGFRPRVPDAPLPGRDQAPRLVAPIRIAFHEAYADVQR